MAVGTSVVWDEVFTAYDFGPTHPMAPVRLDLTTRLARSPRRARPRHPRWSPEVADDDVLATVHDRDVHRGRAPRLRRPDGRRRQPGPRHRRRPGLRRDARGLGPDRPGHPRHLPRGVAGRHRARRQLLRRPAPRDARPRERLLHLQRRRRRHPVAARPRRPAGRLRRHRRAPRRRRRADVLERPPGAHDLGAREWSAPLPRHRLAGRHRRPVRARHGRQRRAAARHRRLRLAALDRVGRARRWCGPSPPTCSSPQHGCDTHMHDPLAHLAITVDAQRRAHETLHELAHETASGRWVALGWRRLRARRGRAALVDPPDRHRRPRAGRRSTRPCRRSGSTTCSGPWGARPRAGWATCPAAALPIWVQPWNMGHNPDNPVDRAVLATRQATFPLHGLDPWFD